MSDQRVPLLQRPRTRLLLTLAVIAIGLAITGFFGVRSLRSFRELQYIREQGLDNGSANTTAIRPWMTIRFIAVAYAVPEEYIYSALNIPFDRRNANQSLGELNRIYQLGQTPGSTELAIIDKTRGAIAEYRLNPVATGLRDVRPWMSIRYIANSSGVPESEIFAGIGLPAADNATKPLDLLAKDQRFAGGPRGLAEAIQKVLEQRKATP